MILSKANSWIIEELTQQEKEGVRYCYIQDIISSKDHKFFISDGLHFVKTTIPHKLFAKFTKGYSSEGLSLKGSVLIILKHNFQISMTKRVEMVISDCIYLGEGNILGDTKDINETVETGKMNELLKLIEQKDYLDSNRKLPEIKCKAINNIVEPKNL